MNAHETYTRTVRQFNAVLAERDALRVQVSELVAERDALRAELDAFAVEDGWLFSVSPARDDALDDDLEDNA